MSTPAKLIKYHEILKFQFHIVLITVHILEEKEDFIISNLSFTHKKWLLIPVTFSMIPLSFVWY